MRNGFAGYFRPTSADFDYLWAESLFAIDTNVLLNLYRYTPNTRLALERTLSSFQERLFLPNQAAKEFLKNRLSVIAAQAKEYDSPINSLQSIFQKLSNKKKHPFLSAESLPKLEDLVSNITDQLRVQQNSLYNRLSSDEILDYVEQLFEGKIGSPFNADKLEVLAVEGAKRFEQEIPPGFRDERKNSPDDPYRRYGDLIIWMQILEKSSSESKPIIFITDDRKDDWWTQQSGRTVSPRPELIEEFLRVTSQKFWMYTVDQFGEIAKIRNGIDIGDDAIDEIIEVSAQERSSFRLVDSFPAQGQKISTQDVKKIFVKFNHPIDRRTVPYIVNFYVQAGVIVQWNVNGWIQFAENDTKLIWHINEQLLNEDQMHGPLDIDYQRFEIQLGREPAEWRLKDINGNGLPLTIIPVYIDRRDPE